MPDRTATLGQPSLRRAQPTRTDDVPALPRALTIDQVCRVLGITRPTYYRYRRRGAIPQPDVWIGTIRRHSIDQIRAVMARGQQRAA